MLPAPVRALLPFGVLLVAGCFDDPTGPGLPALRGVRPASFYSRNFPLAFATNRDGDIETYATQSDNSATRRLTNSVGTDSRPAFSPDGRNLIWISRRSGGDQDIWTSLDDGRKPTILLENTFDESAPQWSPTGTSIVFSSNMNGSFDIYTMSSTGTGLTRLTSDASSETYPTWSPTGNLIAFQRITSGKLDLWVMNSDGTGQRQLTTIGGSNPQWFPTGQKLSFVAPVNGVSQIFTLDVASNGQPVQITTSPGHKWYPAVDVDGLVLAFTSAQGSVDFDLWTVNVNGTNEARLFTSAGDDSFPTWR